jgi:hypothetical protein
MVPLFTSVLPTPTPIIILQPPGSTKHTTIQHSTTDTLQSPPHFPPTQSFTHTHEYLHCP